MHSMRARSIVIETNAPDRSLARDMLNAVLGPPSGRVWAYLPIGADGVFRSGVVPGSRDPATLVEIPLRPEELVSTELLSEIRSAADAFAQRHGITVTDLRIIDR